jgi:hypothetical protein
LKRTYPSPEVAQPNAPVKNLRTFAKCAQNGSVASPNVRATRFAPSEKCGDAAQSQRGRRRIRAPLLLDGPDPALLEPPEVSLGRRRHISHVCRPHAFDLPLRLELPVDSAPVIELDLDGAVLLGVELHVGQDRGSLTRATDEYGDTARAEPGCVLLSRLGMRLDPVLPRVSSCVEPRGDLA